MRFAAPAIALLALIGLLASFFTVPGYVGRYNDDAVYVSCARALAEGRGYILPWSPSPAVADRFPIGYPALIAPIFWLGGTLESQINLIQGLGILLGVGFLALSCLFAQRVMGLPWHLALLVPAIAGFSPVFLNLAPTAMSDLPFALLFVASVWTAHRFIETPGRRTLVWAAVLAAAAFVVRYVGATLPFTAVLLLLARKRPRDAVAYAGLFAALIAPWVAWVVYVRAFGYSGQIAHQVAAPPVIQSLGLAFSGGRMFLQGLPGYVFPSAYLAEFPSVSDLPLASPVLLVIAIAVSLAIAGGVAAAWVLAGLRLPVALVVVYFLTILVWQTGFLNLGDSLTTRLLLPIWPIALATALCGWHSGFARLERTGKTASLAVGALLLVVSAASTYQAIKASVGAMAEMRGSYRSIGALMREFARQVPATESVATDIEPIFYLITQRKAYGTTLDPGRMREMLRRTEVRYLIMTPTLVRGRDLTIEMVKAVNRQEPGLIVTIFGSGGLPTGVFRVERPAHWKY
jgi:hypothetical protein